MRINARLDETRSEKLKYLTATTGAGVSDVLKRAIDIYYRQSRQIRGDAAKKLAAAGFIGVAEADADLSETYKAELTRLQKAKHGHR